MRKTLRKVIYRKFQQINRPITMDLADYIARECIREIIKKNSLARKKDMQTVSGGQPK